MSKEVLQTIEIDKLEAGMFVHAIAQQNGELEVKSKGRISSQVIVERLKQQGITSVIIDTSKAIKDDIAELPKKTPRKKLEDIDMELGRVERLILQCKKTHKRYTFEIAKSEFGSVDAAREVVDDIQKSLSRNPNALLCLTAIKNSSAYLAEHSIHVAVLLCHFAQSLNIKEKDCKELALLGYLYDIGMTQVDPSVLNKTTALTQQEWADVKQHPLKAAELLEGLGLSNSAILAIQQHHERLDGSGYPKQLKGDMINKYARLLAIVDAYDAMTTERPFKPAIEPAKALKTLLDPKNGYDLKLATAFIKCVGIYPVGSLVLLSNKRIGVVVQQGEKNPKLPKVKVFYSVTGSHYMEPKELNLTGDTSGIKVEKAVLASDYKLNLQQIFPNI